MDREQLLERIREMAAHVEENVRENLESATGVKRSVLLRSLRMLRLASRDSGRYGSAFDSKGRRRNVVKKRKGGK